MTKSVLRLHLAYLLRREYSERLAKRVKVLEGQREAGRALVVTAREQNATVGLTLSGAVHELEVR